MPKQAQSGEIKSPSSRTSVEALVISTASPRTIRNWASDPLRTIDGAWPALIQSGDLNRDFESTHEQRSIKSFSSAFFSLPFVGEGCPAQGMADCKSTAVQGEMTARFGVSATAVRSAFPEICKSGEIVLRSQGRGRVNPNIYGINLGSGGAKNAQPQTLKNFREEKPQAPPEAPHGAKIRPNERLNAPTPEPCPLQKPEPPKPQAATKEDVSEILRCGGIKIDPSNPLYWSRREHRSDLDQIIAEGYSVDAICEGLTNIVNVYGPITSNPRSMRQILDLAIEGMVS